MYVCVCVRVYTIQLMKDLVKDLCTYACVY